MKLLRYDEERFPLRRTVTEMLGCELTDIRMDGGVVTRETDQVSAAHARFYERFEKDLMLLFRRFVRFIAEGNVEEPYCYQAVPTFRVQAPGNLAVGEFHRDADYNHPNGEVNFWVPLTPVSEVTSVWIEPMPDLEPEPYPVQPGEVLLFDAVNMRHGNVINTSPISRVSFDFRCLPLSLHRETDAATINTGKRFVRGGYYA